MWNLNLDRLRALSGKSLGKIAIETGTCRGNGARLLAKHFSQVHTIELSEALAARAEERFRAEGCDNVVVHHGSSPQELEKILSSVPISEPIFLFLDAHWSGDASVDWTSSSWKGYGLDTAHLGKGNRPSSTEQCPLLDELRVIMRVWAGEAYILVDDMHNLPPQGGGQKDSAFRGEDWSHLSRAALREIVESRLAALHELNNPVQWFLTIHAR